MGLIEMWDSWMIVAGAAFMLTTTLVAIIYMLSELLQNDKMKGWAKMELAEIFYSALILSMGISGVALVDSAVQGALGVNNQGGAVGGTPGPLGSTTSAWIKTVDSGTFYQTQPYQPMDICGPAIAANPASVYHGIESCHMRLGIWYLREIFDEAKLFSFDVYLSYIRTSMLAEFTINIEFLFEKAGFFTFTPWKGFFTIGNKIKELTFDWATKLMMVTKFQEVMLRFIATALFPGMFVVGAVLRTFSLTRRLGGLMLAMALAMYFIFPAFYAFAALVVLDLKNDPVVQQAWLADSDANPTHNRDPPIADTMYIRGNISMPGGSGVIGTEDMHTRLSAYEGVPESEYVRYMEQGNFSDGSQLIQQYDLSSNQYAGATDAEKNASLVQARAAADSWFGTVSKQNMWDHFVDFAWEKNGPVDVLARLTFWSVFFSLFGILGTIAGIRSLSITFGGDIEIAGLTRLI